jgi:putative ABC transport system permease protein
MLQLKNIKKTYRVGEIETKALDGINVSFPDKEFVAILGESGSGKTTCLNIIGGLDRYDSGDLIIKGKSTKDFKDYDWDAYRNNSIGFVFQNYNLISHLSIVENVEMGMTLSGVSKEKRHKRALSVLSEVGLKEHLHKKPNQLSGGQMQRVAIARALANDPEILLCDEPTGALDSKTSVSIMNLIKEISKNRLVIMVTHNAKIANEYADRIIEFKDGKITSDSVPFSAESGQEKFSLKKTKMNFLTALKLSFNNIRTKKGRTFLTSFASSIGIIGIALILSLSSGFQAQVDKFQREAMAEFPIMINRTAATYTREAVAERNNEMKSVWIDREYTDANEVYAYDPAKYSFSNHKNNITDDYVNYINAIDPAICSSVGYMRLTGLNTIIKTGEDYKLFSLFTPETSGGMNILNNMGISTYPASLEANAPSYLEKNYEVLYGSYPADEKDIVLVVDSKNRVNINLLRQMGIIKEDTEAVQFDQIVGMEMKLIPNNEFYTKMGNVYFPNMNLSDLYNSGSPDIISLKISAIVRLKRDVKYGILKTGIAYSDALVQRVIDLNKDSDIVRDQKNSDECILMGYNQTGETFTEETKEYLIAYLGGDSIPYTIFLYPSTFENKELILDYLNEYNARYENEEDKIFYTDLAASIADMTSGIINGITIVLIAFAAVSLFVSLIMIGIITYTSVLERTKEIGILKALGARKKDIARVFDAETCIIGVFSGVLGVLIAWLLTFPINVILKNLTGLEGVSSLQFIHMFFLVAISTLLTVTGGHIPAKIASKKEAVEALRTE